MWTAKNPKTKVELSSENFPDLKKKIKEHITEEKKKNVDVVPLNDWQVSLNKVELSTMKMVSSAIKNIEEDMKKLH